jgi:aspartate aminotransferase-like enzyme
MKSCLRPGDRVLAVSTGLFGSGIGDMARSIGAAVETLEFAWDEVADPTRVEEAIVRFGPKMVTAVHCETPSGTINPIDAIGQAVARHDVPLFYVDTVSGIGGSEFRTDDWRVDLALLGSQKCLSAPSAFSMVAVSPRAFEVIREVRYEGYDALLPFETSLENRYFPYTPYWHGMAALEIACGLILDEGLEHVIGRHERVAAACRRGLLELGLELYPRSEAYSSPTVTAVRVPESISWEELDRRLRARGVGVGGNYGPLAGKVFRLGHMGIQAREELVQQALEALAKALRG